ncbi:zinc finger protein ZAT9-like [Carex rostrata]
MEELKGKRKFSCKLCEKSYSSGPALGGHMRLHYTGILNRKTDSAYGNEEPEDLTPESEVKDVALALINLNGKLSSGKMELLEIDIPTSGAEEAARKTLSLEMRPKDLTTESKLEEDVALALIDLKLGSRKSEWLEIDILESGAEEVARKSLSIEMWPKDREKIQGTDPSLEEKEKIDEAAKPVSKLKFVRKRKMTQTDVSNLVSDLKRTVYECNVCHRTFRSHQALGGHLSGRTGGRTCLQEDIESMAVVARFNCDGYILKTDVVWAKRRRTGF